MPTVTPTSARDQVAPALQKAQETLTDTVLPAVRDALAIALEKGAAVLDSDTATEAKRRSVAVVKAAKGESFVAAPARRWRFGLGMIAIGTGIGFGFSYLAKKLAAPVDSYQYTPSTPAMPVPSGTDGGVDTGFTGETTTGTNAGGTASAVPAGTATDNIDLRTGAPSTL
jgi:hypothetical protein